VQNTNVFGVHFRSGTPANPPHKLVLLVPEIEFCSELQYWGNNTSFQIAIVGESNYKYYCWTVNHCNVWAQELIWILLWHWDSVLCSHSNTPPPFNIYIVWYILSYHIVSYHLLSFSRSVQDYIIHMDMEIIFVGIKGHPLIPTNMIKGWPLIPTNMISISIWIM